MTVPRGMRAKTIKAVIRKKVDDWMASIDDETVAGLVAKNTIVTGGCIASMLLGEKVNDFDAYFRTQEAAEAVGRYYVDKFKQNPPPRFAESGVTVPIWVEVNDGRVKIVVKSAGIASEEGGDDYQYFEGLDDAQNMAAGEYVERVMGEDPDAADGEGEEAKPRYRPVFLSANAITLSHKIQVVIRFHGDPDEIHANYDFVHCTNYWTSWNNTLTLRPEALQSLLARELIYTGSKYPLCSIIRTRKFIARGWVINAGQYLKMAMQLNQLKLTDLSVLEEQLIGVDAAYFLEVLAKLRAADPDKVNHAYLTEIIDRMF